LNGVGASYDGNATWSTLGVLSDPFTGGGIPVPEPSAAMGSALVIAAAVAHCGFRRTARRS